MVIGMNNIIGGGDSWIANPANGLPDVRTLTTGVNTVTFTMPSLEYGYKPYIECPDGVEPPKFTSMTYNGSTLTVVTTSVTSEQTGSGGTDCKLKIRIIK